MAQSFAIDLSGGAIAAQASDVIIPANSQIIDCVFDIITAANTSTNISVGFVGGAATALVNAYTIGTTAGRQYPETKAGGALAWEDIGTSDQRLNFTNSAATNAGEVRIKSLITSHQTHPTCLLYTSPSPRDRQKSRMPSSA